MANKAISELPQAQNVNNQDLFVLEQSGIAKKLTAETFITEQGIIDALAEALDGHGGIRSVTLSSVSGRIRTYLITFTDGSATTFQVLDGTSIDRIVKTSTAGLTDTYTVFMTDGTTTFFTVTNGADGEVSSSSIATTFDPATSYTKGNYVWYGGQLYVFTSDRDVGAWDQSDVESVAIGNELSNLKSALSYNAVYSAGLLIRDKYITATGEESSYTNWSCTDFLPVKPTQRLYVMSSRQSSYNKFYTANKTAIGTNGFSVEVGENYIDVPSNAAYVRLSNTTAAMDSATIRIIPEIAPAVLAQDNRNDGFFGVLFSVEQGSINTSTGQESSSTDRCRSAFLSLSSQNIVHSEVPFHLVKYNPDKSFNSTVTTAWTNLAAIPEDGLYKLLFQSGSVSSVEEGLYIEAPSVLPTLKEIVGNINSNSPAEYGFHAFDAANNLSLSDVRAFANDVIPAGQYIKSITFHQRSLSAAITNKIEIWGKSGDTLTLLDTINYLNTVSEEKDVTLAYGKMFSVDTMIAVVYGASFTIFAMTAASGNQRDIRTTDKTSTTLNYSGIGKISYRVCVSAKVVKSAAYLSNFTDRLAGVPYNIVRIGAGEKFTEIQDALNFITDDSPSKPYVFQIMPGTYKKFDMTLKPGVRYISMIGTCKKDCIIRDDSGQYYNAPALVYTNGMFKNLTFIATHDTPPALADRENAKHKAYALHMDYGTQDVLFEDCVFVSYQAPAVGIGCYQDVKYHFKNCEMYSYTPAYDETDTDYRTNWTLMANYGALFAHSNTGNNVTNQRLILDNCRMYSQYGNRGMELTTAGDFQDSEMLLSLMGNMAISYAEGSVKAGISPALTIQPESFGNNWDE